MNTGNHIPLCTIAGSDPTGGAGLQGDLKTFAAHGVVGTAVVTAVTVQGRGGVRGIHPIPAELVAAQLTVVLEEVRPAGLKTGMLAEADQIRAVAQLLASRGDVPLVVDPVMVATAGGALITEAALPVLREELAPLADVLTPNLEEAARLLARGPVEDEELERVAMDLLSLGCRAVLLKGGHGRGAEAIDVLATPGEGARSIVLPRLEGVSAHGTGCALAASLAARLAQGEAPGPAAEGAKAYVHRALTAAAARGRGSALVHAVEA